MFRRLRYSSWANHVLAGKGPRRRGLGNLMIGAVSASQAWGVVGGRDRNRMGLPGQRLSDRDSDTAAWASVRNLYGGFDRERTAADPDVAHRVGDPDTLAFEGIPQRQHHVTLHAVHPVRVGDPEGQGKLHAGLGELNQDAVRRLELDDSWRRGGYFDRQFAYQPRIGVVIGAEIDLHQGILVGVGPVGDLLRHQIFVRDQEFAAVAGGDRNIARLHRADPARTVADGDEIARFHRFVHQQDDAADKISHDFLQAKADADTGSPREDSQRREVDADRAHHDRDGEYHQGQPDHLDQEHLDRGRQIAGSRDPA